MLRALGALCAGRNVERFWEDEGGVQCGARGMLRCEGRAGESSSICLEQSAYFFAQAHCALHVISQLHCWQRGIWECTLNC